MVIMKLDTCLCEFYKIFFENVKKLWLRNLIISYSVQANLFTQLFLDKIHLNGLFRANQFYNYLDICKVFLIWNFHHSSVFSCVIQAFTLCKQYTLDFFLALSPSRSVCILEVKHHKTIFFSYFIFQDVKFKIFFKSEIIDFQHKSIFSMYPSSKQLKYNDIDW